MPELLEIGRTLTTGPHGLSSFKLSDRIHHIVFHGTSIINSGRMNLAGLGNLHVIAPFYSPVLLFCAILGCIVND